MSESGTIIDAILHSIITISCTQDYFISGTHAPIFSEHNDGRSSYIYEALDGDGFVCSLS